MTPHPCCGLIYSKNICSDQMSAAYKSEQWTLLYQVQPVQIFHILITAL